MNLRRLISSLWLALALAATFASPAGAGVAAPADGRTVITRDMMQNAGLTRIGDVLFLVDEWTLNTTDGYTWKASPNGLSTFQKQQWIVMLDGQRMDVGLFDAVNLNMLPVPLDQIDSVVVVNAPQLHGGVFADNGLIHFYTAVPREGKTYGAAIMGGNETGDPGPYRHTTLRTPNIDSVGPDGSLSFGFARGRWQLRASATVQVHYFTDIEIRRRVFDTLGLRSVATVPASHRSQSNTGLRFLDAGSDDTWPGMRRVGASIGLRYAGNSGRHEPYFGYSEALKYYHYSEPLGREAPADNRYLHAGISGVFGLSSTTDLAYRLQSSSNRLSRHANALDFDYDWDTRHTVTDAEFSRRWLNARATFGAGVDRLSIMTEHALADETNNFVRIYGGVESSHISRLPQKIGAILTLDGGHSSVGTFWHNTIKLNERQLVETQFSFSQRTFARNNDLWYWTSQGYRLLDDNGIAYTLPENIGTSETTTADIAWLVRPRDRVSIRATGYYRHFSGLYFGRRDFVMRPDNCVPVSATDVESATGGQAAGGGINIVFRVSPRMRGRAYYHYLDEFSGDSAFKEAWRTVPNHKATVQFTFRPYDDVSFWGKMTYLSSTYWSTYERLSGSVCNIDGADVMYSPDVGESTTLDFKARKRLLRGKLMADLICRNAWNQSNRYHPVGSSFDLSFYVRFNFLFHRPEGNP